jgi:D-serine deaminase-like pyridoxal phosphate-dependent protein
LWPQELKVGDSSCAAFSLNDYALENPHTLLTPALLIYPEFLDVNITHTLSLLGDDPNLWRPHIKTAKLEFTLRRLLHHGVTHFKCATTLELITACSIGVPDILVAFPVQGANAERVRQIAVQFPYCKIAALIETPAGLEQWSRSCISMFIDVNPGMNRTGVEAAQISRIVDLARSIAAANLKFRGLHYYDGHLGDLPIKTREPAAHKGYKQLLEIVRAIEYAGLQVEEVITSGTPALPCALSFPPLRTGRFVHRVSPGTVTYADLISLQQLWPDAGYRPAALVLSRVISHPLAHRITCDAGHKALAIDCGIPNCAVVGHPTLAPQAPSEEHLPIDVPAEELKPKIGELLYLVPRHVCPTINNFDEATVVEGHRVVSTELVSARGHESTYSVSLAHNRTST